MLSGLIRVWFVGGQLARLGIVQYGPLLRAKHKVGVFGADDSLLGFPIMTA